MRKYKRVIGSKKKRYGDYTQDTIKNAIVAIREDMSIRQASFLSQHYIVNLKEVKWDLSATPSLSPEERSFVNRRVNQLKNNIPGEDWARSFLRHHSNELSRQHSGLPTLEASKSGE